MEQAMPPHLSNCLHLACIERRIPPAKNAAGGCLAWRTWAISFPLGVI
jgi:hypothetical protein